MKSKIPDISSMVGEIASSAKKAANKGNNEQVKILYEAPSIRTLASNADETKPLRDNIIKMLQQKKAPIDILQTALFCIGMMANDEDFYREGTSLIQAIRKDDEWSLYDDPDLFPISDESF